MQVASPLHYSFNVIKQNISLALEVSIVIFCYFWKERQGSHFSHFAIYSRLSLQARSSFTFNKLMTTLGQKVSKCIS